MMRINKNLRFLAVTLVVILLSALAFWGLRKIEVPHDYINFKTIHVLENSVKLDGSFIGGGEAYAGFASTLEDGILNVTVYAKPILLGGWGSGTFHIVIEEKTTSLTQINVQYKQTLHPIWEKPK